MRSIVFRHFDFIFPMKKWRWQETKGLPILILGNKNIKKPTYWAGMAWQIKLLHPILECQFMSFLVCTSDPISS